MIVCSMFHNMCRKKMSAQDRLMQKVWQTFMQLNQNEKKNPTTIKNCDMFINKEN